MPFKVLELKALACLACAATTGHHNLRCTSENVPTTIKRQLGGARLIPHTMFHWSVLSTLWLLGRLGGAWTVLGQRLDSVLGQRDGHVETKFTD